MTRVLTILAALISLIAFNPRFTLAQNEDRAVEPSSSPTEINEVVSGKSAVPVKSYHSKDDSEETTIEARPESSHTGDMAPVHDLTVGSNVVVRPGESVDSVDVHNGSLLLEGHVRNDVVAVNSRVEVKPGASVTGKLVAVDSSVDNEAGNAVDVVEPNARFDRGRWVDGQIALLGLGLVGRLALLIVAPKASQQVAAGVATSPARCLAVGLIASFALLIGLLVNSVALHSFARILWSPIGYACAVGVAVLLGCGWICGMSFFGDLIAVRLGRPRRAVSVFTRTAVGVTAFCALNVVLGLVHPGLGMIGLLCETVIAVMGLGSILISGFGTDPNWLTLRLRGERHWFTWRRSGW